MLILLSIDNFLGYGVFHIHEIRTDVVQMLLEVNSHMSELMASVNNKQDVLEIVPMQLLLGGELKLLCVYMR